MSESSRFMYLLQFQSNASWKYVYCALQ